MGDRKDVNSYKSILKGTSIFGGVQVFQILINLVRGKFVAMFLGPTGMAISSMFNTSGQTIQQLSSLGLNLAVTKEVAAGKDTESLGLIMATAKRLFLLTSLLGAIACIALAMPLSRITFGDEGYYWQFVLLGGMVFFGVAGQGYLSILQGLHAVKLVSATTICGSLVGLLIGVPLYAIWGDKGIVPAMVILTFSMFVSAWIGVRKSASLPHTGFAWQTHGPVVKKMLMMGAVLMAFDVILAGCNYALNIFIRLTGDMENVGLYQAANSVTNQYSGVVFTAMLLDFFPRLSRAASDNAKVRTIVNRQLEIVALIATPLICLLILTSPLVISIVLTDEFMPILELMRWLGLGVLIKALMFPLGYIAFAKDNKKLFFWLEAVFLNLLTLALGCGGYYCFGLLGLGYSLVVDCAICFVVYYVVNHRMYAYSISSVAAKECIIALLAGGACFAFSFVTATAWAYVLMGTVTVFVGVRSLINLRRKLR